MPPALSRSAPDHVTELARDATASLDALLADAVAKVRGRITVEARVVGRLFDREQRATHGLAWLATYIESFRQLAAYAERVDLAEVEELIVRIGLGELLAQILGGIPMSQNEIVRPGDVGLTPAQVAARMTPAADKLMADGNTPERRARLVELMRDSQASTVGALAIDETYESIRDEMRKFADSEVIPKAHKWHLTNSYIPFEIISQMSELGVFALTIPEEFGGMGLGKESMCVVSEELSRGYIGVGSLGTRSEIAAELILNSGTEEQKR
jgi:(2S)-methylsuccinyl-CoA dehydrogenase